MTERTHSRTGLLMTEIILAVLFFSIAAACCLQVFAGASGLSRRAEQLKLALNSTENLVQQLKASDGELEKVWAYYPEEALSENGIIFYDEKGFPVSEEQSDYHARICVEKKTATVDVQITCYDVEENEIYQLATVLLTGDEYETEE